MENLLLDKKNSQSRNYYDPLLNDQSIVNLDGLETSSGEPLQQDRTPRERIKVLSMLESPFRTKLSGHEVQDEATAWAIDSAALGPLKMSAVFLGPAILKLANQSAAESQCLQGEENCEEARVYGLRPSTLLAASSVIVTLTAAFTMPLVGVMIDCSSHRKTVGAATAAVLVLLNAFQMIVSQSTWPLMWLTQAITDYIYIVHTVVVLAYLQNLSKDQQVLATYTARFSIMHFIATIMYLVVIMVFAKHVQGDIVLTARFSHVISSHVGAVLLGYSWTLMFQNRPPLHRLPEGTSLLEFSLTRIYSTTKRVWAFYPSLKWFLLTLLWSPDAGSGQLMAILSTFQTDFLEMKSSQIALTSLIVLLCTIPGSMLSRRLCHHFNALISFQLCLICWSVITAMACALVKGPADMPVFYVACVGWGITYGWLLPSQRVLFCTLVPPGQETEMMGLIFFFHSVFAFLPPLVFGAFIQAGWSMRLGLFASQDVFFFLALITSLGVGDYGTAVQQARDPLKLAASNIVRDPVKLAASKMVHVVSWFSLTEDDQLDKQ